jgi:hypothetical protein
MKAMVDPSDLGLFETNFGPVLDTNLIHPTVWSLVAVRPPSQAIGMSFAGGIDDKV